MTMKALVKKHAEPGIWLEDVPMPTPANNEVLIKVLRTGICGTDLHIYQWDAWAQRTIPVPMVVGHEFVGEVVEVGAVGQRFSPRRYRQWRGTRRLWSLPQLSRGTPPSLQRYPRRWGQPAGSVC